MKVTAAHCTAIWWAARAVVPKKPIRKAPTEKIPTSISNVMPIGQPRRRTWPNIGQSARQNRPKRA